jgi:hypothetical protein
LTFSSTDCPSVDEEDEEMRIETEINNFLDTDGKLINQTNFG